MTAPHRQRPVTDYLLAVVGVLLMALGGFLIWSRGGSSTGLIFACFGAVMMPLAWVRLIGGVALGGVCIWLVVYAAGMYDYALAAVAGMIGVTSVKEAAIRLGWSRRPPPPALRPGADE